MAKSIEAWEELRKQTIQMKTLVNTPAMQKFRQQQNFIDQLKPSLTIDTGSIETLQEIINSTFQHTLATEKAINSFDELSAMAINITKNFNHLNSFNELSAMVKNITKNLNHQGLFDDINLDDLSVVDEFLDDFKLDSRPDYQEDSSLDLVGNMTRDELRVEMTQAIKDAQLGVSKEMEPKERIRSFFNSILISMGQDVAKGFMLTLIFTFIALIQAIASNNHDFEVGKLVTEKFSENDTVTKVKKAFVKNPEIKKKPNRDMGFLRTESKLRTRPSKKSHLVSKEPISKNTVIFPVHKKGNWILVEVETKDDFYTGWVEESKVIKFKLEGKPADK